MRHHVVTCPASAKVQLPWTRLALGLVIMLVSVACDNKRSQLTQEEIDNGVRTRKAPTNAAPVDPRCQLSEKVTAPAQGSAEWVLQELYTAALGPDDDASFQRFYKHFDTASTAENWARTQYWPRLRQHVAKYLDNPGATPAHFTLCERRNEGPETFRFSIRSNDPKKSNPPITVRKDPASGQHKVIFFSY
jgi:hypothetical protein